MERKIRNEVERSEVERHDDERHDEERVITPDRFLSIWIFLYSLAYLFNLVPYNPIILICIALTFFIFSLFIIIPRLNERSLLLYYITINTLGKILPLLLITNHKITISDIVFTVSFILIYVAYMLHDNVYVRM